MTEIVIEKYLSFSDVFFCLFPIRKRKKKLRKLQKEKVYKENIL